MDLLLPGYLQDIHLFITFRHKIVVTMKERLRKFLKIKKTGEKEYEFEAEVDIIHVILFLLALVLLLKNCTA